MNDPSTIRPATAGDVPAITAIYAESVTTGIASFETVPPDEAEMGRRMQALVDGGFPFIVAEGGSPRRILGYGYVGPYRARPAYRNTVEDSIYLAADARGKGIGGILLRHLLEIAAAKGFRQMVAVITRTDDAASVRLHKAAGFVEVGTLKDVGFKHGRWLDTIIMQRALGPGSQSPPS
jgi:L-amino acid N-acyltransferase YncA